MCSGAHSHTLIHPFTCTQSNTQSHTHTHTHTHRVIHTYTHTHTQSYTNIQSHTHTHTHTHTEKLHLSFPSVHVITCKTLFHASNACGKSSSVQTNPYGICLCEAVHIKTNLIKQGFLDVLKATVPCASPPPHPTPPFPNTALPKAHTHSLSHLLHSGSVDGSVSLKAIVAIYCYVLCSLTAALSLWSLLDALYS